MPKKIVSFFVLTTLFLSSCLGVREPSVAIDFDCDNLNHFCSVSLFSEESKVVNYDIIVEKESQGDLVAPREDGQLIQQMQQIYTGEGSVETFETDTSELTVVPEPGQTLLKATVHVTPGKGFTSVYTLYALMEGEEPFETQVSNTITCVDGTVRARTEVTETVGVPPVLMMGLYTSFGEEPFQTFSLEPANGLTVGEIEVALPEGVKYVELDTIDHTYELFEDPVEQSHYSRVYCIPE